MKATTKESISVALHMKDSGAAVLQDAFRFSKTIGQAVANKKGLRGQEAADYAEKVKRTLRRARLALEAV